MDENDELYGYDGAARALNVAQSTVRSLVARGRIPHFRLSRRLVRFSRRALEHWLAHHSVQPGDMPAR